MEISEPRPNSYSAMLNNLGEEQVSHPDPFSESAENLKELNGISHNARRRATRALEKRLQGKGAETKQLQTEISNMYDVFRVARPPYNQIYLGKLYEQSSYQYAAVNAKVANVVGLGYRFEESTKMKHKLQDTKEKKKLDKMRKKLAVLKDELEELLNSMNEEELFIETLKRAYSDYQTIGNGYLEIGRNRNGTIGYIGHVPAAYVRVRLARDGFVQILGKDAVFFRNFGDTETADPIGSQAQPNELIHLRNYSPSSTYYGVPDIVSASSAVAGNEYSTRFNLDFFEYRAAPRYMIVSKGAKLSDRSEQRLLEFFQEGLKGKNHRSIYVPLPADDLNFKNDLEIKPIEAGIQDASFEKYKTMNRDEILYANRVPITKLGMSQGISIAAAKDLNQTFSEQVCTPEKRNLEKRSTALLQK